MFEERIVVNPLRESDKCEKTGLLPVTKLSVFVIKELQVQFVIAFVPTLIIYQIKFYIQLTYISDTVSQICEYIIIVICDLFMQC